MDNNEKNTQMFMYLVGSFEMSAMMAMGKMKNPMTDKIDKDMTQAQFSIDILDMLVAKTKGNISEYEQKFLENTLGQLKLNFIDETNKESASNQVKSSTDVKKTDESNSDSQQTEEKSA